VAVTITGGKYASASVSSVGTTTVTVSTTPFVSTDFAVSRRADLYDSAGTTYKGSAFVRSWVSTSQLQLETAFYDFNTGITATQVVGDTVLISKNWADSVTAGITAASNFITVSDVITFGTGGVLNSVSFHDEAVTVQSTVITSGAVMYTVAGGMLTFGHLQDYTTKAFYNPCRFTITGTTSTPVNTFMSSNAGSSRLFMWGPELLNLTSGAFCPFGSGFASGVSIGSDWNYLYVSQAQFNGIDCLSVNSGGSWTTGANHVLSNCTFVSNKTNSVLLRWGNGTVLGGAYKLTNNSTGPISVFGADAVGTYAISAPASTRLIVSDVGPNALWRSSAAQTQTINFTNVISPDWVAGYTTNPESNFNTNATKNLYYQDSYTNLQDATLVAAINNSAWTADSTVTSSGSASTASPTVFRGSGTGGTLNTSRSPWTIRVRKYGYNEIEQSATEVSYSLGTAGTGFNVSFGGLQNQIARTTLPAQATADAYTGISIVNHGASPVTWNGKSWGITITGNLSVNSTLTAAQIFAYVKSQITKTATWGGQAGYLWHVLVDEYPGGGYNTYYGASGGAGTTLKGVRVIDQSGNAFKNFVSMQADDGTYYLPPQIFQSVTVSNGVAGTRLQIYDLTSSTELYNGVPASWPYTWTDPNPYAANRQIRVRAMYCSGTSAKIFIDTNIGTSTSSSPALSYLLNQVDDTVYAANAINGATVTGITISDTLMRINVTSGTISWPQIYAYETYWLSLSAGIIDYGRIIYAKDTANYILTGFLIKNTSSPSVPLTITNGYGVDSVTGQSITLVDTTGGTIFNAPDHVTPYLSANQIADTILKRSTANVEGSSFGDSLGLRSLYGMIAQGVHNTQVVGTSLKVTKSDDTTVLGTRTVTTDSAAQPITGINSD
jgi:hypothetical protein